jgi:serine phosphatase RsbU (regulator of sigma subunit)
MEPTESSIQIIEKEISLAEKNRDVNRLYCAQLSKGRHHIQTNQLDDALISLNLAYLHALELKTEHQMLEAITLLSKVHLVKDLRIESLEYLHKGYSISEQLKDTVIIGWYLPVIVQTELETGNIGRAMEFGLKATNFFQQTNDTIKLIHSLLQLSAIHNQLGNLLSSQKCIDHSKALLRLYKDDVSDYAKAQVCISQAHLYILEQKLEQAKSLCYEAIGIFGHSYLIETLRVKSVISEILAQQKRYDESETLLEKTIEQQGSIGDHTGQAYSYLRMANLQKAKRRYHNSIDSYKLSLSYAVNAGLTEVIRQAFKGISQVNNLVGGINDAYTNLNHYTRITDSLFNAQKISEANKLEENATHQQHLDELQAKNIELARSQEQINQQKKNQTLLVIIIGLFVAVIVIAIRESNHKKKANELLVIQKTEVERQKKQSDKKTRNFTESLNYAKRMQKAILMSSHSLQHLFPESFTILIPKDIVSGDFYWVQEKNDRILFALADCTGHGVPGALMSVIGTFSLNKVVNEQNISSPGEILHHVNLLFEDHLKQRDPNEIFDGMDIALCCYNPKSSELKFSGANLPLYICRANEQPQPTSTIISKGKTHSLYYVKPTKQPIGSFYENKNFKTHSINLITGDTVYLFTDGFSDQFGGPEGRKFKSLQLYRLLLGQTDLNLNEQKLNLEQTFANWKGSLTQVDDVSLLGIKI